MGTEIFKKIAAWYRENRKYDGFVVFVWFLLFTTLMFIANIVICADREDWIIWTLWLLTVIYHFCFWQKDKHRHEVTQFLIDRSAEMVENLANELAESQKRLDDALARITALRLHLIGANRRRKRAEKQLKWYRNTLRKESAERLGFEVKADEYEFYLLIAQCAIVNDAPDRRDKFLAWMKKHPDIEERQAKRQYLTSLYESFFFGDAKADPKETYAGLYGSEEFGQQLFADAAQDANACLGASLGIKPEDEQPQS